MRIKKERETGKTTAPWVVVQSKLLCNRTELKPKRKTGVVVVVVVVVILLLKWLINSVKPFY